MEGSIFSFACANCNEDFETPDQLRTHEKTHTVNAENPLSAIDEHSPDNVDINDTYKNVDVEDSKMWQESEVESPKIKVTELYQVEDNDSSHIYLIEDSDIDEKPTEMEETEPYASPPPNDTPEGRKPVIQKDGYYICQLCYMKFEKFLQFKYHYRRHSKKLKKNFVSTYCDNENGKIVGIKMKRRKTIYGKKNKKIFQCDQCVEQFSSLCNLKKHVANAHEDPIQPRRTTRDIRPIQFDDFGAEHQCSFCPASYSNIVTAREHEKTFHSGETPYVCEFCKCSFSLSNGLKCHLAKFHKEVSIEIRRSSLQKSEELATMPQCDTTTSDTDDQPYFATPRQSEISYDNGTNSSNRILITPKYKVTMIYADDMFCSYCPASFNSKLGKKEHEKIHTGETPYPCEYCPVTFRLKCTFLKHMESAHPNKPFSTKYAHKCDDCDGIFGYRERHLHRCTNQSPDSSVTNHITHENSNNTDVSSRIVNSLSGQLSRASFGPKSGLVSHVNKVHHKNAHFSCKFCSASFERKRSLINHVNRGHPETVAKKGIHGRGLSIHTSNKNHVTNRRKKQRAHANLPSSSDNTDISCEFGNSFSSQLCPTSFEQKCNLVNHENEVHQKNAHFSCKFCSASFEQKRSLINHVSRGHPETVVKKQIHQGGLSAHSSNENHVTDRHTEEHSNANLSSSFNDTDVSPGIGIRFSCQFCPASFERERSLFCHSIKVHQKNAYFSCKFCSASFERKRSLINHVSRGHPETVVKKQIHQRGLSAHSSNENHVTDRHTEEHSNANLSSSFNDTDVSPGIGIRFSCQFCPASFERKRSLFCHSIKVHQKGARISAKLS